VWRTDLTNYALEKSRNIAEGSRAGIVCRFERAMTPQCGLELPQEPAVIFFCEAHIYARTTTRSNEAFRWGSPSAMPKPAQSPEWVVS